MTPYEQEFLEKYLAHRNVLGDEGGYPDSEAWCQAVRYRRPKNTDGSQRDALQGHPGRRPGL